MIVFKPEDCIVKWSYLVEDEIDDYECEVEDDTRDSDGAPMGTTHKVSVSFTIEDFENRSNVKMAENGPASTTLKIDRTWNRDTKFMTLAELMDVLSKAAPDGEVKVNYGGSDISQEIDQEGIYIDKAPRGWPSDPKATRTFPVALVLGTYEAIEASEQDIEDYAEQNSDYINELAYEAY